jgi:hypothetical protein
MKSDGDKPRSTMLQPSMAAIPNRFASADRRIPGAGVEPTSARAAQAISALVGAGGGRWALVRSTGCSRRRRR